MNLYEGIYMRKSVRHYCMEKVEEELLNHILNFTGHLQMLDDSQQVQFEIIDNTDGKGAPYYLVLSALPVQGYLLNAGFLMQQVMLYIMTKGLGSCFMQYHSLPIKQTGEMEPVIMLAFGKTDKGIYRETKKAKRLEIRDICCFKTAVSEDIRKILSAARLAPSSLNSQPWRFVAYENRIHLFCKKEKGIFRAINKLNQVDVGNALANMYLAAEELWYFSDIKRIENLSEQSLKNNEYVISIFLHK